MPSVLLFLFALVSGTPVSAPQPAPAAHLRMLPEVAFSGDRALAVWWDGRDCDEYEGQSLYAARFDRDGRILDPKGFVIQSCNATSYYGKAQVFAEPDGWSVSIPGDDSVAIVHVSREATIGAVRTVDVPLLFDPRVTRGDQGWFIHNALGDETAIFTDLSLHPLARLDLPRFGTSFDDATDGRDYISVVANYFFAENRGRIVAEFIGGDGTRKRSGVVILEGKPRVVVLSLSVVWTGSDYLVAWIERDDTTSNAPAERRIMTTRVSRDGSNVEAPRLMARATTADALTIDTRQLRRDQTLVTWADQVSTSGTIIGCDSAPFQLPPNIVFASDGTSLLRIRSENVNDAVGERLRNDLYSAVAPIGCNTLQWSSEQLVSAATVAQELPAVAGNAIAWIELQPSALRGVRLDANGAIVSELRFARHAAPRKVRLAFNGDDYLAVWNDGGLLTAGRVVDSSSIEQPEAHVITNLSYYDRGFEATWSGSEFLVIYPGVYGEIRVARFAADGTPILAANAGMRHRTARFGGLNGEILVPVTPNGYAFDGASVPKIAWSGNEALLVWEIGAPCGIIPECFPPRILMMRIDAHGRALDAPRSVAVNNDGVNPDVIWTGSEYLVAWSGITVTTRRFARDGQPIDAAPISLGITPTEAPLSLAMLGNRPLVVIARKESIEGYALDSQLQPERFIIADTTGSGRTFADAETRNGEAIVAFHRAVPGEAFGGSTRVFYSVVGRR
jgi:hypothetical protein